MANDLTGLRVGRLTVVCKTDLKASSREYLWKCICDCGETVYHKGSHLNCKQPILSCGCLQDDKADRAAFKQVYRNYRNNAKQRGLQFDLTEDEFENISTQPCHYCGRIFTNTLHHKDSVFVYSGIDRRNNDIGYVIDNCLPCCRVCNRGKRGMSYIDFCNYLLKIADRYKEVIRGK